MGVMPSFSLQIRASGDGGSYRLDEGDIIEWGQDGSVPKRGRITSLLPRNGQGRDRVRPICVEPVNVNNSTTGGRERWISRWAVMRVYDGAGNAKSPIEEQEGLISKARMRRR
jgi:hypothetical protein